MLKKIFECDKVISLNIRLRNNFWKSDVSYHCFVIFKYVNSGVRAETF